MTFAINQHRQGEPEHHKTWITTLLSEYYDPCMTISWRKENDSPSFKR